MTTARPALNLSTVRILPLTDKKVLDPFACGERDIDRWVSHCCALQDKDRVRVFCAMQTGVLNAYGFYSLSVTGENAKTLSAEIVQHHNQAGYVPFIYIDYLAVQKDAQNQGLGTVLFL